MHTFPLAVILAFAVYFLAAWSMYVLPVKLLCWYIEWRERRDRDRGVIAEPPWQSAINEPAKREHHGGRDW